MDTVAEPLKSSQTVEPPTVTPQIEQIPNPFKLHGVDIYSGNVDKMDVFNNGENGQDRAVTFQLKMGVQKDSFALQVDPQNSSRILNLPDSRDVQNMQEQELQNLVLLQKVGIPGEEKLVIHKLDGDRNVTADKINEKPILIRLSDELGVEVLNFDPKENSITIHKTKLPLNKLKPTEFIDIVQIPPIPIPVPWQKRLLDIIGPVAITATATIAGSNDTINEIPPAPPPIVESVPSFVNEQTTILIDRSLECPQSQEREIGNGDFLTKELVDVNGIERYLTSQGSMDVNKLYQDLMCLIALPENRQQLEKSDPLIAKVVNELMQNQPVIGPVSADMLYDAIKAVNTPDRFPGANNQLVLVYEGQSFSIPDFNQQKQGPSKHTPNPHYIEPKNPPFAPPTGPEPIAPLGGIPNPPRETHIKPDEPIKPDSPNIPFESKKEDYTIPNSPHFGDYDKTDPINPDKKNDLIFQQPQKIEKKKSALNKVRDLLP